MMRQESCERARIEEPIGGHDKRFEEILKLKEDNVYTDVNSRANIENINPEVESGGRAMNFILDTVAELEGQKERSKDGEVEESSVKQARDADNPGEVQIVGFKEADSADTFRYLYWK